MNKAITFILGALIMATVLLMLIIIMHNGEREKELLDPKWKSWTAYTIHCPDFQRSIFKNQETGELVVSMPFTEESKKIVDISKASCVLIQD